MHGRVLEIVTSNQKSDAYLLREQSRAKIHPDPI